MQRLKTRKDFYISLICGIITSLALCVNISFEKELSIKEMFLRQIDGIGIDALIILVAIIVFYTKMWGVFRKVSENVTHIISFILSVCMMVGLSYSELGTWDFIFGNKRQLILASVYFAGYFILFDVCICVLYWSLTEYRWDFRINSEKRFPICIEQHYTLFAFVVISFCWLPYLIINLPGSVPYDGYRQLNMFYNIEPISNHHPWVVTKFFGYVMEIGRYFSDNVGVFFICFSLFLIEAFCYAKICKKIKSWSVPYVVNLLILSFYAIFPVFGSYAQVVMKDGVFAAFFALFIVYYIDICLEYLKKNKVENLVRRLLILFVCEILVCISRNNGIHMVLIADFILFFYAVRCQRKYIFLLLVCLAFSFFLVNTKFAALMGVEPGSKKEVLSVPFQQTARYLKEYPEDVNKSEQEAIRNILSYDTLAEKYVPERSDPVKDTYRNSATNEELLQYFKAWFSMFLKHPDVYFQATFNNSYGYYYPFYNCKALGTYQFYIQDSPLATGEFDIHYIFPENVRSLVYNYAELWKKIPGLAQLINPGTYTWGLLILIGFLCYRKRYREIYVIIPAFLNILICIVSPVNGYLRYALPLVASMPVLVYWCLCYEKPVNQKK